MFLAGCLLLAVVVLLAAHEGLSQVDAALTLRAPDGADISLIVADTATERTRGLGGRPSLGSREGMLFVFPERSRHGIWMKDMMFPLDIIWLDERKPQTGADRTQTDAESRITLVVVDLTAHVAPETFPESFTPREEAQYILEVNAGVARETGIQIGETLELISKPYRNPKIRGIRGKNGADEEGVARYSDRG